jgi:RNA 2',3'-cyclic 3'-phosphodiesterase
MRAFLAVPPDPEWAARVEERVRGLRPSLPSASWTRPESWHLTLRFFREISAEAAQRCADETFRAVGVSAAELPTGGSVVFPPRGRPRVLGLGFAPSSGVSTLEVLAAQAEAAARRVGAEPEGRVYHPHVTLARIRSPWPHGAVERFRREVDGWELPSFHVGAIVLYESRVGPSGAVHTPVRTLALALPRQEVGA